MQNLNKLQTPEEKLDFLFKKYAELVRSLILFVREIQASVRAEERRLLAFQVHHYRMWPVTSDKPKLEFIKEEYFYRKKKQKNWRITAKWGKRIELEFTPPSSMYIT